MSVIRSAKCISDIAFTTVLCWNKYKWCPRDIIKIIWKSIYNDIPKPTISPYTDHPFITSKEWLNIFIHANLFDFITPWFKASNGLTLYYVDRISEFSEKELFFDMAQCQFKGCQVNLQRMNFAGVKEAIKIGEQ